MKKTTTHHLVKLALMSTLALVLYMFEFPLPGTALQFDLSDFPVIVTGSIFGFVPGVIVALLKNVMHLMMPTRNANFAGEVANFGFAVMIMAPFALIKVNTLFKRVVLAIVTIVSVTIAMNVFNYYITFPLYGMSQEGAWTMIYTVFMPFNIIKASILLTLFTFSRPYLDRMIKK